MMPMLSRASGLAIALWFGFVLVFDLLMLGLLVASGGELGGDRLGGLGGGGGDAGAEFSEDAHSRKNRGD